MKALNWIAPSVLLSALLVFAVAANAASPTASLPISRNLEVQPSFFYTPSEFTAAKGAMPTSRNRPVVSDMSQAFTPTDPCVAPVSRSVNVCNN